MRTATGIRGLGAEGTAITHERQAIRYGRVHIAKAVNATVIGIEDAPRGYAAFDQGASSKYVLDPQGALNGVRPL